MDDMAAAHARDYRLKGMMDDASRALKALCDEPAAIGRLSLALRDDMQNVIRELNTRSERVVRTWD